MWTEHTIVLQTNCETHQRRCLPETDHTCRGQLDGDYQSCESCHRYISCRNEETWPSRPCPEDQSGKWSWVISSRTQGYCHSTSETCNNCPLVSCWFHCLLNITISFDTGNIKQSVSLGDMDRYTRCNLWDQFLCVTSVHVNFHSSARPNRAFSCMIKCNAIKRNTRWLLLLTVVEPMFPWSPCCIDKHILEIDNLHRILTGSFESTSVIQTIQITTHAHMEFKISIESSQELIRSNALSVSFIPTFFSSRNVHAIHTILNLWPELCPTCKIA